MDNGETNSKFVEKNNFTVSLALFFQWDGPIFPIYRDPKRLPWDSYESGQSVTLYQQMLGVHVSASLIG